MMKLEDYVLVSFRFYSFSHLSLLLLFFQVLVSFRFYV
ncbi:hypothetical protein YN1HA_18870 [Sulfurisphaera ohwakuensis]